VGDAEDIKLLMKSADGCLLQVMLQPLRQIDRLQADGRVGPQRAARNGDIGMLAGKGLRQFFH
jgi:hypothetical protein